MIPANTRLRVALYVVLDLLLLVLFGWRLIVSGSLAWLVWYFLFTSLLTLVLLVLPARRSAP